MPDAEVHEKAKITMRTGWQERAANRVSCVCGVYAESAMRIEDCALTVLLVYTIAQALQYPHAGLLFFSVVLAASGWCPLPLAWWVRLGAVLGGVCDGLQL